MISGRDALGRLERAIAEARGNEGRLDAVLKSAMDEGQRLRSQLAESYRQLALVRLDLIKRDEIVGELDASERRAKELIAQHKRALDAAIAKRAAAQAAAAAAAAERHKAAAAHESAVKALDEFTAQVEERIKSDPQWQAQKARCDAAADVARAADEKADTAEADREAKRKPYESDPLFMYLWGRGFETRAYDASFLVRYADRKVARLVNYATARPNYAMLIEIPQRLREHANARADEFAAEEKKIEAIERAALEAAGAVPLEEAVRKSQGALDAATARLVEAEAALKARDGEHDVLVSAGDDGAHKDAVDVLAQALSRDDVQTLYQEAFATKTTEDERMVRAIEQTLAAIAKSDKETADIRAQVRDIAGRRAELEGVRDRVRRSGYDDPYGRFELGKDEVLGQIIGGILGGLLRGNDLWRELERGYRRAAPRSSGGFGGGLNFPLPGGISKSGGFKTGGIRFGGRHGGFKTGGRF